MSTLQTLLAKIYIYICITLYVMYRYDMSPTTNLLEVYYVEVTAVYFLLLYDTR